MTVVFKTAVIKSMQILTLKDLISPLSIDEFFQKHWPRNPLFISALAGKFQDLLQLKQLQSLENLVEARQEKVRACLPDFDDEYSSILIEPKDALKAYRNNMTLVFDGLQNQDSYIAKSLLQIRHDLGLISGPDHDLCRARSIAYATPAGGGTRMHFDANANFIIQISGSKQWTLAPNTSVVDPTERFTVGSYVMPAALEKQCHDKLIDEPPEDSYEVVMTAGCLLYVPRGYWHATTTYEDSLSLNFTFSQPTWADVFTKSLQEHLLVSSEWRALADGLESTDKKRKDEAIQHFEGLVKKIASEMPQISGQKLLSDSGLIRD